MVKISSFIYPPHENLEKQDQNINVNFFRIFFKKNKCTHVRVKNPERQVSGPKNKVTTLIYFWEFPYGSPCTYNHLALMYVKKALVHSSGQHRESHRVDVNTRCSILPSYPHHWMRALPNHIVFLGSLNYLWIIVIQYIFKLLLFGPLWKKKVVI